MVDQLKTLGKYHVLERLAATPLAEIYKVKTVGIAGFEKVQVLKRVMPRYSQDQGFVQAFIEEAKIAFSLNHRNIVQVFEFGKIDEELFLASEYIPGVNLRQVLHKVREEGGTVPVGLACYLMGEVAAGLEYAHHKSDQGNEPLGVVHADLAPSNIACSFEGSVKALDFGIARAAYNTVPQHDRLVGLPRYVAPEQIRGESIGPQSDIFSFGTILWELLTGMPLFEGETVEAVQENVLHAPIPRPRSLNREVPEGLDEAAMRCLERRAERRFASANDLQLELHRIQREVGAVIGSRALSTFLQELLAEYGDTRDVRQEEDWEDDEASRARSQVLEVLDEDDDDGELTIERRAVRPSAPPASPGEAPLAPRTKRDSHRDLIAAAAELAMPHNPPARPVNEDSLREPAKPDRRGRGRARNAPRVSEAGVLRPSRDADDELPPKRRYPRPDRGLDIDIGASALGFERDETGRPTKRRQLGGDESQPPTSRRVLDETTDDRADHRAAFRGEDFPTDNLGEEDIVADDPLGAIESCDELRTDDLRGPRGRAPESLSDRDPHQQTADSLAPQRSFDEGHDTLGDGDVSPVKVSPVKVSPVKVSPVEVSPVEINPVEINPVAAEMLPRTPVADLIDEVEASVDAFSVSAVVPTASQVDASALNLDEDFSAGSTEAPATRSGSRSTDLADLPDARDELDEPDDPASVRDAEGAAPTMLGERKRFISVSVRLAGLEARAQAEALDLVANIAYKLDGLVHEQTTEGLMVIFGLPAHDENDIVSAVRFAFDSLDAAAHLQSEATGNAAALEIRFGVRAGTARLGGHVAEHPYQVLGRSLAETEALADHAPESQILVAGAAARLAAAHYVLRETEPVHRHGKPIRCHRVMAVRSGVRPREREREAPLFGREVETKALRGIWREVVTGEQQRAVIVIGDPGVGKTRLVDDFIVRHCGNAMVLTAAATPHRVDTPFAVIVNLLRSITGIWGARGSRSRARLLGRLEVLLDGEQSEVDGSLDAFASVLDPADAPVSASGGGFARNNLYLALRRLVHRAADQRPLVIHIEDLHWADSSSLECLQALVERASEAWGPLLLLFTARADEGSDSSDLLDDRLVTPILLEELGESHRQRLIVDMLAERASDEMVSEVERRAGGSPFLIRELCHAIKEGAETAEIPSTVQGLITARVDRLAPAVKVVLQHATVIGPVFREAILTALLNRNPARPLAELRNRGFLVPCTDMAVPFNTSATGISDQFERQWSFRHVLVQQAVYESLNGNDRRQIHRRVGEIMLRRAERGSSDPPAEIARHLELGGLRPQAGDYYLRAADAAAAAYANREAAELYDRALRLTESDADLQYAAFSGRERIFGRLGLHSKQAADLLALRKLTGTDPKRLADLRTREAVHLLRLGELYRALEAAEQAEKAAGDAGDELRRAEALRLRGEAYGRLNDHSRAIATVTKALQILDEHPAPAPQQVRARIGLGRIYLLQANYDGAFEQFGPALELIQQTGDRWQERILRNNLAVIHACRGEYSRAIDEARFSLQLCEQFGDRARAADNTAVLGIVYLELGMYDRARSHIERALVNHRETRSQWSEADSLVYAGLLETAMRRYQRALRLLEQAKQLASRMGAKYITVNARNAIALALCDRNQPGDAAIALDEATEAYEMAQAASLVVGEIPGLSRAARSWALLDDLEEARALSRRAVELLREQKNIESAEEEIHYTYFRILDRLADPAALEYIELAHSGFMGKAALLDDPDARQSLSENVRLYAAIRRDYRTVQQRQTLQEDDR